jgi:hypothetical protein
VNNIYRQLLVGALALSTLSACASNHKTATTVTTTEDSTPAVERGYYSATPPAPGSPEEAAETLRLAWKANNRSQAAAVAEQPVIDELFGMNYPQGEIGNMGCELAGC